MTISKLIVRLITGYQKTLSAITPHRCRFYPSCSEFTKQEIQQHGPIRGLFNGFKQVVCCHPFYTPK